MSTQPTAPAPTDIPVLPAIPAAPAPTPPTPAPAQETNWKAEAEKWESRSKANFDKATRFDALEEASKTEAQKLADRATAAEAKVTAFEAREQVAAWKATVSTETGVPVAALAGSTLEDLQAHAAVLKTLITNPQAPRGPLVPTEGTGSDAPPGVSQITDAVLATMTPQQINEARRAGRLNKLLGIN